MEQAPRRKCNKCFAFTKRTEEGLSRGSCRHRIPAGTLGRYARKMASTEGQHCARKGAQDRAPNGEKGTNGNDRGESPFGADAVFQDRGAVLGYRHVELRCEGRCLRVLVIGREHFPIAADGFVYL